MSEYIYKLCNELEEVMERQNFDAQQRAVIHTSIIEAIALEGKTVSGTLNWAIRTVPLLRQQVEKKDK